MTIDRDKLAEAIALWDAPWKTQQDIDDQVDGIIRFEKKYGVELQDEIIGAARAHLTSIDRAPVKTDKACADVLECPALDLSDEQILVITKAVGIEPFYASDLKLREFARAILNNPASLSKDAQTAAMSLHGTPPEKTDGGDLLARMEALDKTTTHWSMSYFLIDDIGPDGEATHAMVYDPATGFWHDDDAGAPAHGIRWVREDQQKPGWMPISTAPRDGTKIICYWPSYGYDGEVGQTGFPHVCFATWGRPDNDKAFLEHFMVCGQFTPWEPTLWTAAPETNARGKHHE